MWNAFLEIWGLLTLVTGAYCVWLALGAVARSFGLTRWQLLGLAGLAAWLLG